ncbi:MAG: MBL fold metallo-hydrolase [Mogibacterium sp.]|nr:MBL fold metallo-hydrolase [Mogibacterium sp.]
MNSRDYYQFEDMGGFYRIGSPEGVFCYLILGTKQAMLIDTGYGLADLKAAVDRVTDLPLVIVNTHGHCDHIGGNGYFDVPCYIHNDDVSLARQHAAPEIRRQNALRMMKSMNYETGEVFNALPEDFDMDRYCNLGTGILLPAQAGKVFDLGGATMELVWTPGHTEGGISVFWHETGIMFVGDAVGFFVWLYAEHSTDMLTYLEMLEKIDSMPVSEYYGGHNPMPMHHEDFDRFKRAALEADYSKGIPFESFMDQYRNPRTCAIDGMTLDDMFKPGFAAVVIAEDWH